MKSASLDLYRTFWAVGKTKNLTKASEQLFITQPGVSLALKNLESQLGTTLCIRSKKGVTLTKEGEVLFEELDKAFTSIERAERKLDRLKNLESGSISISAGDTICNYYLLGLIIEFTTMHPEISLQITNRTTFESVELLKAGKIDFGFINLPYPDDKLRITLCRRISEIAVCGEKFSYLTGKKLSLRELLNYPMIMLEQKSNSRLYLDTVFKQAGAHPKPVFELGSVDLMLSFIKNNLGIGFIPYELCGHYIDGKTLFRLELSTEIPVRGIGLIELPDSPSSHAASEFKRMLLSYTENEISNTENR
jgi:DNA-binding transcriptional LysR family regulator